MLSSRESPRPGSASSLSVSPSLSAPSAGPGSASGGVGGRAARSPEDFILATLSNLATTYSRMGRNEEAVQMQRDVYSGRLKLNDEEHYDTLWAPRARCLTGQFADWSCGMPKYTNDWHCRLPSS